MTGGRPWLDFPALLAATQRTVSELHEKKQLVGHLERAGVRLVRGHGPARFIDSHHLIIGDRNLRAERLIIACGGHARRLAFPGSELTRGTPQAALPSTHRSAGRHDWGDPVPPGS